MRYQYLDYTKEHLIQRIEELETLNQELKELSELDSLTKISNQRALLKFLNSKITMADKNPLCLAMFDIDDFKRINDTLGHVYGNEVLTRVAEIIQSNIRKTDLAGRYGGDEFMIIFTNTDLVDAQGIAERIRQAVEDTMFKGGLQITISGGVKQHKNETSLELIHFADRNLYRAKGQKNNIF